MLRNHASIARARFGALALLASPSIVGAQAPDLPGDVADTLSNDIWDVRYTDDSPYDCSQPAPPLGADLDFAPMSLAREILGALLGPLPDALPPGPSNYIAAYRDLGFGPALFDLDFSEDIEFFIYDCGPDSGVDPHCDTAVAAPGYSAWAAPANCNNSEQRTRFILGHELFHYTQYGYVGVDNLSDWGSSAVEGTARMMEDHVFMDLDQAPTFVVSDAQDYLANPNRNIWSLGEDLGYESVLAWKYAAEQYGQVRTEPETGVDVIRRFWEKAGQNQDSPSEARIFGEVLKDLTGDRLSPGSGLDAVNVWFQDFSLTNLVRRYDLSDLSPSEQARHTYLDEADGFGTDYGAVAANDLLLPGGPDVAGSDTVEPFGAVNYRAVSGDCTKGDVFGFRASYTPSTPSPWVLPSYARWGVMGADNLGRARFITRAEGEEFAVATAADGIVDPGGQLAVTVTGGSSGADYEYEFACGPGSLEILFPKTTDQQNFKAFVGPSGTGRQPLLIGLRVTGPAALTKPIVKGLRRDDFLVFVGISGQGDYLAQNLVLTDVGESYLLAVYPPDLPATQDYDLTVWLGGFIIASEPSAVSYEQRIVDEMLVLDTSGSMADPGSQGGEAKLSTAVTAADLLAKRANALGKLGLVEFNSSASLEVELGDLTPAKRAAVEAALASLGAGGSTSIGDGLDVALNEFISRGSSAQEDWALLLSDGRQRCRDGHHRRDRDIRCHVCAVVGGSVGQGDRAYRRSERGYADGGSGRRADAQRGSQPGGKGAEPSRRYVGSGGHERPGVTAAVDGACRS